MKVGEAAKPFLQLRFFNWFTLFEIFRLQRARRMAGPIRSVNNSTSVKVGTLSRFYMSRRRTNWKRGIELEK